MSVYEAPPTLDFTQPHSVVTTKKKQKPKPREPKANRTDHQEDKTKNKAKSPGTSQEAEECGESEAKLAKTEHSIYCKTLDDPPPEDPRKNPRPAPAQTTEKARKERVNIRRGRGSEAEAQPGKRM